MNRAFVIVLVACAALCARGQDALNAFTNRADQLLRPKWGFGVNEIPVFCSTNPLVRYNGGVHYLLQQAVNAYDQTNHTDGDFDFPSVFRPQFGVVSNELCVTALITNWVEVTTNYAEIIARPFKAASDPTLSADDNVRGIGLIVGFKPAVPTLDQVTYANIFNITRKLMFTRPNSLTPPKTNQMYILGLSNAFAVTALNRTTQTFPRDVTMYFTNSGTIIFTNEVGIGVTNSFTTGNTLVILSNRWPGYQSFGTNKYKVLSNGTNTLPFFAYNERNRQFVAPDNTNWELNVGLPVHSWMVQATNRFIYALLDNSSGRILDFVNFANLGMSVEMVTNLANLPMLTTNVGSPWLTNDADSSVSSPASAGVLNQIAVVTNYISAPGYVPTGGSGSVLTAFLQGGATNINTLECPYQPSATLQQIARWWAATPGDHFTSDEMDAKAGMATSQPMQDSTTLDPYSGAGTVSPIKILQFAADPNKITLQFNAYTDGPYGIWSSSNLVNWTFVGLAANLTNNVYGVSAPVNGNCTNLYFQARKL